MCATGEDQLAEIVNTSSNDAKIHIISDVIIGRKKSGSPHYQLSMTRTHPHTKHEIEHFHEFSKHLCLFVIIFVFNSPFPHGDGNSVSLYEKY